MALICLICGRSAVRSGETGRLPTYCSHACRQRAYVRRHGRPERVDPAVLMGLEPVDALQLLRAQGWRD